MNITIKATNIELTPDIRAYLDKRLSSVTDFVDKHAPASVCDVEVGKTTTGQRHGDIFRAEINIDMDGQFFRASAEKDSINTAIDAAKNEMLGELRRNKEKQVHLLRRGGQKLKEITQTLSVRGARLRGFVEKYRRKKR
jgi:ribosomal subunit interface protein